MKPCKNVGRPVIGLKICPASFPEWQRWNKQLLDGFACDLGVPELPGAMAQWDLKRGRSWINLNGTFGACSFFGDN